MKQGVRAGSMNGTYLDGVKRICDAMITWLPGQALMLGDHTRDAHGNSRFAIEVTYVLQPDTKFGN